MDSLMILGHAESIHHRRKMMRTTVFFSFVLFFRLSMSSSVAVPATEKKLLHDVSSHKLVSPQKPEDGTSGRKQSNRKGIAQIHNGYTAFSITAKQMAYIRAYKTASKYSWCSATILDSRRLLTAAHCVDTPSLYDIRVWPGNRIRAGGTSYSAKYVDILKGYDEDTLQNDLAIIWTKDEMKNVLPVNLANWSEEAEIEELLYVSGFGVTSSDAVPSTLQTTIMRVESSNICKNIFKIGPSLKASDWVCVTDPQYPTAAGTGSCGGDSGGPVFAKVKGGKMVQKGVYSFRAAGPCVTPGQVHMYTNVVAFRSRIQAYLSKDYSDWREVFDAS